MKQRIPLGDTGWQVWAEAGLRSAGFAAEGLDLFSAPDCARVADSYLDGLAAASAPAGLASPGTGGAGAQAGPQELAEAVERAIRDGCRALNEIVADPLLREAVTWQNPIMLATFDALLATDPGTRPRLNNIRKKERAVLRYWQRYCGKNDTIGFFGPICWVPIEASENQRLAADPGEALVSRRRVSFEHWVIDALASQLAADPEVRPWLAPVLPVPFAVEGRSLLRPAQPPLPLSPAEEATLLASDGQTAARDIAGALAANPALGLRSLADAELLLERLIERGLLEPFSGVPVTEEAAGHLAEHLARIGDPAVQERALARLEKLTEAKDRVALAAGDAAKLALALRELDAEVTAIAGTARRRPGEAYAGRTPSYEDTLRDVSARMGTGLLDDLADPLSLVLQQSRWLTQALARPYREALDELYEPGMRLGDLWYLAQGLFWGQGERPLDPVAEDFSRRWSGLFGLDSVETGVRRIDFTTGELRARLHELFPATNPAWSTGTTHSPDLQLCASGLEAINRGDYMAVLGEMHAAKTTLEVAVPWHTDTGSAWAEYDETFGEQRPRPLYPASWPRHGSRLPLSAGPARKRIGFTPAARPAEGEVLPAMAIRLDRADGELVAIEPDGTSWPIIEVFAEWLSIHAVDAFKLPASSGHQPRITVDRLVLSRETWRLTVGKTGLTAIMTDEERYLAARRLRHELNLPEQVYIKIGTETKPTYADLTGPHYVSCLASMFRSAQRSGGDDVPVTITEALPNSGETWLPDAQGRRYMSELRLHITDPAPVG
jgi:hypothetical protein